jgi:Ca-activated chloride channel family protein
MRFAQSFFLWALLGVLPTLVFFLAWAWRKKHPLIAQFVRSRRRQPPASETPADLRRAGDGAAIRVTCASPQWGLEWEEAKQRGLDIVVALDVSKSMLAEDVRPNRLERAKLAALDLARFARSDRLALVPFAGSAFLQCPLTLDTESFVENVRGLDCQTIPRDGTALPEAIETALAVFPLEHQNEKALVIISDGENHEGDAVATAQKSAKAGMRIFTIGVGTTGGELIRERDTQGRVSFHRDAEGHVVKTRLGESLLQQIAKEGNGFYLPLQGASTMELLYRRGLEPMPKSDLSSRRLRRYHEHYAWPLALAIVFLLVEMFVPERKAVKGVTGNRQLDVVRNP